MTDDALKHLCRLASIWSQHVLSPEFNPADLGGVHPQNIRACHRHVARAFVELLKMHPELKPRFRIRGSMR